MESASAQSSAAKFNSEVAAENATLANQQATTAIQAGEQQAAMSQQKTRATVGAIEAGQAAGNIDVNSGSAVDVRSSASELGELDALTVRSNAARTAFGYETQAAADTGQSQLENYESDAATTAGDIGAGSSLLGGLSSAGTNYAKFLSSNSPIPAN
jgi:metal-dependent amidase/aminoacylase/carboxypeptidase family protein